MTRKLTPFPTGKMTERLERIAIHGNSFNARVRNLPNTIPSVYKDIFSGYRTASKEERGLMVLQLERFEKYTPEVAIKRAATIQSKYRYQKDKQFTKQINRVLKRIGSEPIAQPTKQKPFERKANGQYPTYRALEYINYDVDKSQRFKEQYIKGFEKIMDESLQHKEIRDKLSRMTPAQIFALQKSGHDFTDIGFWYNAVEIAGDMSVFNSLMDYVSEKF